ncbi:transposase [Serpentinimonas maccroryi]|nr:transposase [Serpentinimonas maccroryi]
MESLFRTAKYRPQYPEAGFADLQAARQWASNFVHWYNHEHRHSGIRWRHAGAAPCRTRPTDFASTPRPLRPSPRRQPAALVWPHARLVTHQNRHPQP